MFGRKQNNVVVQGTTVRPVPLVQAQQKPRSALVAPASHPTKGTPARVIGSFAMNYTNAGGGIISSGTSLEHRGKLTRKR